MSNFNQIPRPTPFGLYDSDPGFQRDADSMVVYVMRKLGEDVLNVGLTKKEIWGNFEEATRMFNAQIIEYQARSNLVSLLGSPTGSYDAVTGQNTLNLTNNYIMPNLEFLDRMAEPYANIIGYGPSQDSYSGSITFELGRQDYDLYTDLKDDNGVPLYNMISGSGGKMRIFEVFHFAPIQYMFQGQLSSLVGSEGGIGLAAGGGGAQFHILPIFEDLLRASMMETAQKIRRSNYTYKYSGRNIRFFPQPSSVIPNVNDKVWLRVGFSAAPSGGAFINTSETGTSGSIGASGFSGAFYGVSNPANMPAGLINYSTINQWAKNWIARMTFSLSKETLGYIRRKVKRIPIPGSEVELDGSEMVDEAREEQEKLLESITEKLESLSYDKLQEQETAKAENLLKQLATVPMPPTWSIVMR